MAANQFVGQCHDDSYFLTIGMAAPPVIVGGTEERRRQLAELSFVPVTTLGRYAMSRRATEQLIVVLTTLLENADEAGEIAE